MDLIADDFRWVAALRWREDEGATVFDDLPPRILHVLATPPEAMDRAWVAAALYRLLERGFRSERYRAPEDRLRSDLGLIDTLARIVRSLQGEERGFAVRLFLMLGWERLRAATGLRVRPADVVGGLTAAVDCDEALRDVCLVGGECLLPYLRSEVFPEWERYQVQVDVSRPGSRRRRWARVPHVRIGLNLAVKKGWEASLRPVVPIWLAAAASAEEDRRVAALLERIDEDPASRAGAYLLLGLADWSREHLANPRVEAVLERLLVGSGGNLRKSAVDLAARLGQSTVLEHLSRADPDAAVRKRATSALSEARRASPSARRRPAVRRRRRSDPGREGLRST